MQTRANNFILDLYHDAQAASVSEFADTLMRSLKQVIRFDSGGTVQMHVAEGGHTVVTGQAAFNVYPDKARLRTEYIGAETYSLSAGLSSRDPLLKRSMAQPNRSHSLVAGAVRDKALREYARRTECLNAFIFLSPRSTSIISCFSLWRAAANDRFTEADLAITDLLIPHAFQAIAISRKLAAMPLTGCTPHAGQIIAEQCGMIHHLDDAAVLLLRREYPDWLSSQLPQEVLAGLGGHAQRYVGRHIILSVQQQGKLMVMSIQGREPGRKLTAAELRVVQKIVEHGSYKEAARQLGVSPNTVRNQLQAIYQKLGIGSKSELIKVLAP